MALRRAVFEEAEVVERWRGALSDDYALTQAIRAAGRPIVFVPSALVGSAGELSLSELFAWCSRQIAITRVYWPGLFRLAAVMHLSFAGFVSLGIPGALVFRSSFLLVLVSLVLLLSWAGGTLRTLAVRQLAPEWQTLIDAHLASYVLLVPLASFLTALCSLRALLSRRIEWRGRVYEMVSPSQTRVVSARR